MVITGATGGIGKELKEMLNARPWDPRKEDPPRCSVLINCFGISEDALAHDQIKYGDMTIMVNLTETLSTIKWVLPYMRMQNYGRIINLTSFVAYKGIPGTSAYAASKGGLDSAIKAIAVENARHGVLINNLCLGYFDYGMTHRIKDYKKLEKDIPVGRFGKVEDIYRAIGYLVDAEYITGQVIHLNGGLW